MSTDLNLLCFASDIETVPVEWLWHPYIPFGKITIVQGEPGCGKTMLAAYIISRVTTGRPFDNDDISYEPMVCIYQTGEDGLGDTIKPRLEMMGADCSKAFNIDEGEETISMLDKRIEEAIIKTSAKVIVLDPIQAYLGGNIDMHRANEVRPILQHLGIIAEKYGVAFILISHLNKGSSKAAYRTMGSIDFSACARSVLTAGTVRDDETIRVFIQTKNSLDSVGTPVDFSLNQDNFQYIGEYEITIEELLGGINGTNKTTQAIQLIKECINNNHCEAAYIYEQAREVGISKRTVDTAKKKLKIQSIKKNNIWYWKL